MLVNDEVIKTQVQERIGSITEVSIFSSWQGKADCRLVYHIDWSVKRGCEKGRCRIQRHGLHCVDFKMHNNFHQHRTTGGVSEVWWGAQAKDSSLFTPCFFGAAFCSILVKVHVLSGNDDVSKVGTKHAALTCNPFSLTNFDETDSLTKVDMSVVERYLVKVWDGACSNNTADIFDKLRHDCYLNEKELIYHQPRRLSVVTLGGASV